MRKNIIKEMSSRTKKKKNNIKMLRIEEKCERKNCGNK